MEKVLLHTCCAPCGTRVFERLINEKEYAITSFYYNPNTKPKEEWEKRLGELERLIGLINEQLTVNSEQLLWSFDKQNSFDIDLVVSEYNSGEFDEVAEGLEDEPEGGNRCEECFRLRLRRTAEYAKANGFEIFGTTLTVSPHKNAELINRIGREIGEELGIEYLERDFKKDNGYKRSIELCKEIGIYRQNYCGCRVVDGK